MNKDSVVTFLLGASIGGSACIVVALSYGVFPASYTAIIFWAVAILIHFIK